MLVWKAEERVAEDGQHGLGWMAEERLAEEKGKRLF